MTNQRLNNQTSRYNNQIITNHQFPITKQYLNKTFGNWLLGIEICLYLARLLAKRAGFLVIGDLGHPILHFNM